MELKLGLDIGVSSVGWGIIDENYHIIDCGVRLFSENKADSNSTRRTMRSSRRRIRRLQHRLERLESVLYKVLGVGRTLNGGNSYEIRCRGLQQQLTKEELYAAVMHLAKRRGTHFLTAEDFYKEGEEKSTEEILQKQAEKLVDKYVCQIQYEKYLQEGKVRGVENRFQNQEYRKELIALLTKQGEFYPNIKSVTNKILEIYDSKRHYSIGPGGPNSPTPYGSYRYDQEGNVVKVNLIDLMRGKCTFFPEEKRIAQNSYTACLFNLLNDLNNMMAADQTISFEQKKDLIEKYINEGKNISLNSISKVTGVKAEELRGYRIDKDEKAIFTEFTGYKAILKVLAKAGIDNTLVKGNWKMVDKIADILTLEKEVDKRYEKLAQEGIKPEVAHELKKLSGFTKYHSLSQKAIDLIMEELWQTNENQMQLFTNFTKIGLFKQRNEKLCRTNIPFDGSNWIISPITKRAVNEAIKVINQARAMVRKKYNCEFAEIVIEMAREKNSDEQVAFIKKMQKQNENLRREIGNLVDLKKLNGKQFELIKLLFEQDFRCAYSGKAVSIGHVLNGFMEVDHIIPKSLSFDDSMANKVAVLYEQNQKKGQTTPFQYLKSGRGQQSYEEFKAWVLNNESYKKNKKKKENLLYQGNPQQDLKGFINRNLVDTRYACKEVLNLLQAYFKENFKENQLITKVSVVKGSFTHAFRKKAHLDKDRDATYAHHAQDALIVAGLSNTDLMKKVNTFLPKVSNFPNDKVVLQMLDGKLVDITTGEVIEEKDFACSQYIRFIKTVATVKPKYSHKVDRKPNRALYDQQIKSTRVKDGKTLIITKYKNIYDKGRDSSGEKLKKKIQTKPEALLMYHNDSKTFELLQQIVHAYPDSKNPFADYYAEHGAIRKYCKKGQGPIVSDVKFYDGTLGSYRLNKQKGKNLSVYLGIKTMRADFYLDHEIYKFVAVPYDMVHRRGDHYYIDMTKYKAAKESNGKKISESAEFLFSLHSGEVISYEKDGKKLERYYKCINDDANNKIELAFVDKPTQQERQIETFGKKIKNLVKYHVDVLGNNHKVKRENFSEAIQV